VVITGGSSGIGRATGRRFAAAGANVVLAARSEAALEEAVAECRAAGGRAIAVPVDVADPAGPVRLVNRALQDFGRVDVWVNSAGVMSYGALGDTPIATQRRIIEVNLLGVMWGTRAVLPTMKEQKHGVIINVSSLYGKVATPYVSGYAASKFGILGFSQVVRQELRKVPGVSICVVLPGSMDTPIFRNAANYTGRRARPVPPVGDPDRVARAILRLARRPRRQVTVGMVQHLATLAHAWVPGLYAELAPSAMRFVALGKDDEERHEGNVFDPLGAHGVTGGWRHRGRNVAVCGAVVGAVGLGWAVRSQRRRFAIGWAGHLSDSGSVRARLGGIT